MSDKTSSGSGSGESYTERVARIFGPLESQSQTSRPSVPWESGSKRPRRSVLNASGEPTGNERVTGRVRRRHDLRYTPDYLKRPEKWVKYDLTEDGTEKMEEGLSADQINKAAAFQFLQSRGNTAGSGAHDSSENETTGRVVFKRPNRSVRKLTEKPVAGVSNCHRVTANSAAHVMKEYEVGAKREQRKKKSGHVSTVDHHQASQSVHLRHLEDDDV